MIATANAFETGELLSEEVLELFWHEHPFDRRRRAKGKKRKQLSAASKESKPKGTTQ